VKNRFQNVPFKFNLRRYIQDGGVDLAALLTGDAEFDSPLPEFFEKAGLKELC
jgi:hypothetical protein